MTGKKLRDLSQCHTCFLNASGLGETTGKKNQWQGHAAELGLHGLRELKATSFSHQKKRGSQSRECSQSCQEKHREIPPTASSYSEKALDGEVNQKKITELK